MVLFVTFIGAIFRFINLWWDNGGRLHPDEALIVNAALSIKFFSHLNPGFHDYNGFSTYLLAIVGLFAPHTPEAFTLIGRWISAFVSTATIPVISLIGTRLHHKKYGIYAAACIACMPILIQLAHFYTSESLLVFFFSLLLLSAVIWQQKHTVSSLLWLSISMGILLGIKNTAYVILPIPFAILFFSKHRIRLSILFTIITLVTFALVSPYSFIDMTGYLARSRYLSDVVTGKLLMDWTLQFQNTTPLYWIPNLAVAFGPTLIGLIGVISLLMKPWKRTPIVWRISAIWTIGFLVFLSGTYLKFIRYSAPLAPLLALFTAYTLTHIRHPFLQKTITALVIGTAFLWSVMVSSIYMTAHTTLTAADWIQRHIPNGSLILTEEWNSIIRFTSPGLQNKEFGFFTVNTYTTETTDKLSTLNTLRAAADYIIFESPKIETTISRLRDRYPKTYEWYKHIEDGSAGYQLVAVFRSYPRIGPFAIPDEFAEETWTVFDHPTVRIYKNTRAPYTR